MRSRSCLGRSRKSPGQNAQGFVVSGGNELGTKSSVLESAVLESSILESSILGDHRGGPVELPDEAGGHGLVNGPHVLDVAGEHASGASLGNILEVVLGVAIFRAPVEAPE